MRDRLRESLQFLSRVSHSVTDLLSRAMPLIYRNRGREGGRKREKRQKEMSGLDLRVKVSSLVKNVPHMSGTGVCLWRNTMEWKSGPAQLKME